MIDQLPPGPLHTNAELEALVSLRGGLFWLEGDHQPWVRQLFHAVVNRFTRHVTHAKSELYKDKPREIEFGFLSSTGLNAFAYASPETEIKPFDFIGINVGVVFTLLDTFSRVLANPHTFPDVGSPQVEKENVPPIPFLSADIMTSGFDLLAPTCPIRSGFAIELTQVALDFLFFHESTHLRNGHLEFARRHLALTTWAEAVNNASQLSDKIIRQALEIDADAGAILLGLNHVYSLKDRFAASTQQLAPEIRTAMSAAYGSIKQTVRVLSYSSYFVFRLFDMPTWLPNTQPNYTHPFPPIRMFYIGVTLYEIFRTRSVYQYDAVEFCSHHAATVRDAEVDCGLIQGKRPDPQGILSVIESPQQAVYMATFKKTWGELRPILDKYKRGGALAE